MGNSNSKNNNNETAKVENGENITLTASKDDVQEKQGLLVNPQMTIVYSCIARGTTVLCKHQTGSGTFQGLVDSMLPNIPTRNDGKTTYKSDNYLFHCMVENGIIYLCAATPQLGKGQPYAYLAEIKRQFQSGMLSMRAVNAGYLELNHEFNFVMEQEMEKFSKAGAGDGVSKLRSQVDEVKEVMTQNIERVLERGDRLDDLIDKTEDLENSAASFQKTARKIRKKYWWKNKKMTIIIVAVVLGIILIIVLIILATQGVFDNKSNSSSTTTQSTIQNG